MATYRRIIEGLQLLASCDERGMDGSGVQSEHDEIYAGPVLDKIPEDINKKLEELGWHKSDADCWAIFT